MTQHRSASARYRSLALLGVLGLGIACGGRVGLTPPPDEGEGGAAGSGGAGGTGGATLGGTGGASTGATSGSGGSATGGSTSSGGVTGTGGGSTVDACMDCIVTRCPDAATCFADPACVEGLLCTFTTCSETGSSEPDFGCVLTCFNNDAAKALQGISAVVCIGTYCVETCEGGGGF
jgi:hypothetical protein